MQKHKTVLKRPQLLSSRSQTASSGILGSQPQPPALEGQPRGPGTVSGLIVLFVVHCLQLTLGSVTFAVWFVHPGGGPPRKNPRWSCFNLWHHLCLCVGSKGGQGCKDPLPPLSVSDCGQESWLASFPSPLHTEWVLSACGGLNFPSGGHLPLWRVFA